MDPMSIPILPHLPAAETWRESTYPFASRRSPVLQTLDDALETYENSFRRYGGLSQAYYLALHATSSDSERRASLELQSVREQAGEAFSRAVHDFEAVDVALNTWVNSEAGANIVPAVSALRNLLSAGRSQLKAPAVEPGAPQQRHQRGQLMERRSPVQGRAARHCLKPPR
jgi:hypothetical protein